MNVFTKRVIAFFVGPVVICSFSWLVGYDFNVRGESAALIFLVSILFGIHGAAYPFDEDAS